VPPRISQRIGPPRKVDAILNEVVPVEAIERDRCQNDLPEAKFLTTPGFMTSIPQPNGVDVSKSG